MPGGTLPAELVSNVSSAIVPLDPAPETTFWSAPATVTAIASADGVVVVGTTDGVYRLGPAGLEPMTVYAEEGEPLETGAVSWMVPLDGGALIVADHGIFHTYLDRVLLSPLSALLDGISVRDACVCRGVVWIAAEDGLYRVTGDVFERVSLDVDGAPTAVAASSDRVLVAFGAALFEIDPNDDSYYRLPDVFGVVSSAASDDRRIWVAETSLARREGDGRWVRDSLSGAAVSVVTAGGYAVADSAVIRVADEAVVQLGSVPGEALGLALDGYGNVWAATADGVTGFLVGDPVRFGADIAPILIEKCGLCHADGYLAPLHDFSDYATVVSLGDAVLQRVITSQMPPQGLPGLSQDQLADLTAWFAAGMQE